MLAVSIVELGGGQLSVNPDDRHSQHMSIDASQLKELQPNRPKHPHDLGVSCYAISAL